MARPILFTLTDGINTFDLMPSDNQIKLLLDSFGLNQQQTAQWHIGEDGRTWLLKLENGDRMCAFDVNLYAADVDEALNAATELRRWLYQAGQAELSRQSGNVRPVWLHCQVQGQSNITRHRVRVAKTEEAGAWINQFAASGGQSSSALQAHRIGVALTLDPYGTSAEDLFLNTAILNGDFARWNPLTSMPHNWETVNGGETVTMLRDRALVGPRAVNVVTTVGNHGLRTPLFTVPRYHLMVLCAWMRINSGEARLAVQNSSGNFVLDSGAMDASDLAAAAEDTRVDDNGYTWHLVLLQQITRDADSQYRVSTLSANGAADYDVSGVSVMTVECVNLLADPGMDVANDTAGWGPARGYTMGWIGNHTTISFGSQDDANYLTSPASLHIRLDSRNLSNFPRSRVETEQIYAPELQNESFLFTFGYGVDADAAGTGTDNIIASLRDGADNIIDSLNFDPGGTLPTPEDTVTGDDGNDWNIYVLGGVNNKAPGVKIVFENQDGSTLNGGGEISIDETYLLRGAGPVFRRAQVFGSSIRTRGDYTQNSSYVDHLAFYGGPGDLPAGLQVDLKITSTTSGAKHVWLSRYDAWRYDPPNHYYEAEDSAGNFIEGTGGGGWADQTDATRSGGKYRRWTSDNTGGGSLRFAFPPHEARAWGATAWRCFVLARSNNLTGYTIRFKQASNQGLIVRENPGAAFTTVNTWEWLDLGPFTLSYSELADAYSQGIGLPLQIHVNHTNTRQIDIDAVVFLPVGEGRYVRAAFPTVATGDILRFSGLRKLNKITRANEGLDIPYVGTGVWELPPGNVYSKVVVGWCADDNEHALNDTAQVKVRLEPRTSSFLIGNV